MRQLCHPYALAIHIGRKCESSYEVGLVSFYVAAHQDDWQLFRGEVAWSDLHNGADVVFVYVTAGDAGRADGWWQAREAGALASTKLAMDHHTGDVGPMPVTTMIQINGHAVAFAKDRATRTYFLRLPDGNLSPDGALPQLLAADTPVETVDGGSTYTSAADLVATLRAILERERHRVAMDHPWINAPDFDEGVNPGDNPDHWATGEVVRRAAAGIYSVAWWVGYDVATRDANIDATTLDTKRWLFATYNAVAVAQLGAVPDDEYAKNYFTYESWLNKSYARSTAF